MKLYAHQIALLITSLATGLVATDAFASDAPDIAESACMVEVNRNYRGNVRRLEVIDSEYSHSNSTVTIDADGEHWKCLVSNNGYVEDLRVVQRHSSGGHSSHGRGVTLYRDTHFRGRNEHFTGDVADLRGTEIAVHTTSSVRVSDGCGVTIYEHTKYKGKSVELYRDVSDIRDTGFPNDQASSIRVWCD